MRNYALAGSIPRGCGCAFLVVFLGCGVLEEYVKVRQPSATLSRVSLQDISLDSATLRFEVEVENPYAVPLPLVNLDYSLGSRGQEFLSGAADVAGSVPAGGRKTIPLPAKVTYVNLLKTVAGIRPGDVVPYAAELGLSVDAPALGRLRIPLMKEGELPVPTVPEVKVSEIRWDRLSLGEAAGRVKLDLVNRNRFPVEMAGLNYALALGGVEVAKSSLATGVSFAADGGAGTVEIPISLSPSSLGMGVFRMLTSEESGYSLRGNLQAKTPFGPIALPLESSGTVPFLR